MTDKAKHTAAISTLEQLGYTYRGGALWVPPFGKTPDFCLLDALRARIAELEAEITAVGAGGVQALSAGPTISRIREYLQDLESGHGRMSADIRGLLRALELDSASPTPPAEQTEDEGISREQWIDQAVRVYLIAGDTEDQALECAAYLWGELDMDDLADPYDAAMSDIEERGPAPEQPSITSESSAVYAELPEPHYEHGDNPSMGEVNCDCYTADHLRDFADRTHALRQAAAKAAPAAVAGPSRDLHPEKCPITGRPFFMTLDHPELGVVPTYGGPYDSYTIPAPEGELTDPWHERDLRSERYDHDAGWWVEGGEHIPLRIVHEDVLFKLQADAEAAAPKAAPGEQFDSEGFRAWVRQNLPDDTIIGSSLWWANHLTEWAQRFAKTAPRQEAQEPVAFMSPKQLAALTDPEGEHGTYLPARKTSAGLFTQAIYTAPQPAAPQAAPAVDEQMRKDAELWRSVEAMVSEVHGGGEFMVIELSARAKPEQHLKTLLVGKVAALAAQGGA